MEFAFDFLLYTFEMFTAYIFISYNYEPNRSRVKILLWGLSLFSVGALLLRFVNIATVNLIAFFIINLLFFKFFFDVNLKESFIFALMLDAIMFSCEMITIYFFSMVLKIPTDTYSNNFLIFVILTLISKILYFALAQLLAFLIGKLKFKSNKSARYIPLFIFPLLSIAFSFLFLRMSFVNHYQISYNMIFIVLSILMIVSCIYIFYFYQSLAKSDEEISYLQAEMKINEINDKHLEILKHQNDEMQMLMHDTKNHYIAISNMDNTDEIQSYVSDIMGDIQKYNVTLFTNNKMLDLLLSKYSVLCKSNKISLSIDVKTANLNYISDSDLSAIVNNVMDNAVEAAKFSEEKVIDFSILHKNGFDVLNVSNSSDSAPKESGGTLITTKQLKSRHGYGTKIINKYVKKNNAMYTWNYDPDSRRFISTIVFRTR